MKKASKKDMNYDYSSQKEPMKPMGQGSYANMPEKPMITKFPMAPSYRAGIINDYTHSLDEIAGLEENFC